MTGCLASSDDGHTVQTSSVFEGDVSTMELSRIEEHAGSHGGDLCEQAASLPDDELCSKLCDPDAFVAHLAELVPPGRCYQIRCELPETIAHVGVCLL